MGVSFRTAVFNLCKKVSSCPEAQEIKDLIHNLSVVVETAEDDPKVLKRPPHGDLAYIGAHQRIQFLGYLFADESVDDINKQEPFSATALDDEERKVIEEAHNTIRFFLDSCMDEIKTKYPKIAILVDPYSQYRKPKLRCDADSFLSEDDVAECIAAFKTGKVYKKIITNEALRFFDRVNDPLVHQLVAVQTKQFTDDMNAVTKETEEYFHKLYTSSKIGITDVLMLYTSYCYALRKSIGLAAQMLYEAILGLDMPVMNNDNIIDLVDHQNNIVYEKYVVLTQEMLLGFAGSGVGSIALLTCDPSETHHIKEFGEMIAMTVNLMGEFGSSSKVTMITVDEELNPIHCYTDAIMETKLGQSPVVVHDAPGRRMI